LIPVATISIGDELLSGRTVETNTRFIAETLALYGLEVVWKVVVGDELEAILEALELAFKHGQIITVTGGLGPTHDDVTKAALVRFFNTELKFYPEVLEKLRERFKNWGRSPELVDRSQAEYPATAKLLENPVGTAQGMWFQRGKQHLFAMPGVPREMQAIVQQGIVPVVKEVSPTRRLRRELRTAGIPEIKLYRKIQDLFEAYPQVKVAYLPHHTGVTVRLTLDTTDPQSGNRLLDEVVEAVRERAGKYIYGLDDTSLAAAVGQLLQRHGLRVVTVESCTGGLIAGALTDVSGSSEYFHLGLVTYGNDMKNRMVGVSQITLETHGAVSEATVREMLQGGLEADGKADYAVAVSGIAGPTGGTPEKPVGLVYVGVASRKRIQVRKFQFGGDRRLNREMTVTAALNMLRLAIMQDYD